MKQTLIIILTFICYANCQKSLFATYTDIHEIGKWEGYVYYLNPFSHPPLMKPLHVKLNESILIIDDYRYDPIDFRFSCDYEQAIPCAVTRYLKLNSEKYKDLDTNYGKFVKELELKDPNKQCLVLEISWHSETIPHILCTFVLEQEVPLKMAIKKAYMRRMNELPIDAIPSTVQIGEQFQIKYSKDQFFSYTAQSIAGSSELTDKDFNTIIKYESIRDIDGTPCKVSYQGIELPDHMEGADANCCVNFLHEEKKWYLCSNKYGDCVSPIRTLTKFMIDQCAKKHPSGEKPGDSKADLEKFTDSHDTGLWGGWGYYTELPDFSEKSEKPIYIKVDKKLTFSTEEFISAFLSFDFGSFNWFCGSNKICSFRDFLENYTEDNKESISKDFSVWLTKVKIPSTGACAFFEMPKMSVVCLHREDQMANFKAAILYTLNKKEQEISVDADSLSDNSIVPLTISNGENVIEKKIQFANDRALEFDTGTPVIEYKKMESVLGNSCDILHSGLNLPEILHESSVNDKCCIGTKYRGSWLYFCDKEAECEMGIEKVAKTLRAKCMKGRYPETSEGGSAVDFNKDVVDEHNEGNWKGYVHFAKLGQEPSRQPMYFQISKENDIIIQRGPHDERDKLEYKILNNEWLCSSELPCSVEEYIARRGVAKLNELFGSAMKELNIDSMLQCLALEIRSKVFLFSERHVLMVCPYDRDQVMPLKLAIKNAYGGLIEDAPADTLPFAAEGTVYDILMFNQNTKQLLQTSVMILPDRIQELVTKEQLLSYHELQPMSNLKCGLEFRHLELPDELTEKNADPECCFAALKNRDKIFVCVNSALHCVLHSKMMLKRIKADCIRLLSEEGKASNEDVVTSMEQVNFDDSGDTFVVPSYPKKDDWHYMDYAKNIWKGKVHYLVLDKNDKNEAQEVYMQIENGIVRITPSPEDTEVILEKPIATLFFECNSPVPCVPSSYLKQTKKGNPSADQKILEKMFKKFFDSKQNIQETQCLILEFEDPLFHAITSFMICTEDSVQGPLLRQSMNNAYEHALENTNFDGEEGKFVPNVSEKDIYSVAIIDDSDEPKLKNVVLNKKKVKLESTDAAVIRYSEIEDCKISQIDNLPSAIVTKTMKKCCITVLRFGKKLSICALDLFRCIRSRTMMAKKMRTACLDFKRKNSLATSDKPFIAEVFDYGRPRDGKEVTPDIDLTTFKIDLIEDAENGRWKGWVYAMPFTERDPHKKIYAYYISLDKNKIVMRAEKKGKIVQTYITAHMNWICDNFQPCKPSSYLMYYRDRNDYIAQVALKDTVLSFIKQLPVEDEKGCVVLEFEDPNARSINSEMLCTIDPEEGQELRNAISNAYYLGILKAEIKKDIPMPSYMTEKFIVKMWEENRLIEDTIKFDPDGILKEIDIRMVLYNFKDIAQDSEGNNCALWFKNLKLPKDFGDDVDSNCCFTFMLKKGFPIYFCSAQKFRCIGPVKRIIKKTKYGCLMFNKNRMPNPYENQNSAAALTPPDQYDQILYDDSKNGIWKGLAFLHKIGDPTPIPDSAYYLVVENGYLGFYLDNRPNQQPIEDGALIVRNLVFPCEDLPYTCDLTGYKQYYRTHISNDKIDQQILKKEMDRIISKLPKGLNYDHCCSVVSLVVEGEHEEFLICTRSAEQGENIKRAISVSFDTIITTSNINLQIPLAHTSEVYPIQIYDPKSDLVHYMHVRFGMKFVYDSTTHAKILKYSDVQPDKYGKKCALWFKQLKIPKQMTPSDNACCFMFIRNSKNTYICSDSRFHCLKPARVMMKTIRDGCLKGEHGINLDNHVAIDTPEYNSPYTEILGEPPEDDVVEEQKEHFPFKHSIQDDLEVDEEKGIFKGWVMQSVLPNKDAETLDPREVYISISPTGWDNFLEKEARLIEHFAISDMELRCDKEFACKPNELLHVYEHLKDPRININLFSVSIKQTMKYVFEESCVAVDFFVTQGGISQKRMYCLIAKHEKVYKSLLKVINKALQISLSVVPYDSIKLPDLNEDFHVEYIPAGKTNRHNLLIKLGETGLEYNNEPFLKYKDTKPCEFCYGVQDLPPGMHANHDCCIRFKKNDAVGIMCEQQQYRCEYKAKSLTKFMYERCINLNPDSAKNPPGYCLIEKEVPFNPEEAGAVGANSMKDFSSGQKFQQYLEIVDEDFKLAVHVKELIENKLLFINKKINSLNKNVVSSKQEGEDVYSYNSDGSLTIEKPDGSQTIQDSDKTLSKLKSDKSMEITTPEGSVFFIDAKGETLIKLSDGEIIASDTDGGYTYKEGEDQVQLSKTGKAEIARKDGRKSEVENGKAISILPDGTKLTRNKNGDVEMEKGEEKMIISKERRRLFRFKEKAMTLNPGFEQSSRKSIHRHSHRRNKGSHNCTK